MSTERADFEWFIRNASLRHPDVSCPVLVDLYDLAGQPDLASVRAILRAGKYVEAVKEHRVLTGGSLKESKDAVDRMRAEMTATTEEKS